MKNKKEEKVVSPLGRVEPEFKFDVGTVIFVFIGGLISWLNMLLIFNTMEVWAFLSIIFIASIPGVIIACKNRYWGYGFMLGYSFTGIPFAFFFDIFIGLYVFFVALCILIIMWLIFWKIWRSLSSIKREIE